MTREEKAIELCRRLTSEIAQAAPVGSGMDDTAWLGASGAADRFITELHRWEDDGDKERVPVLRQLYSEALTAWTQTREA